MENKEKKSEETKEKKEEKGIRKLSVATINTILLVVALVVILVMAIYIVDLKNDKAEAVSKLATIQEKNVELNRIVSQLQSKLDNIAETINSGGSVDFMTNEEAEKILKDNFSVLEKIYLNPGEFFNVNEGDEITDFEERIGKYATNNVVEEIKNNLPMCIRFEGGKYILQADDGARAYNGFDKFEDIRATDQKISATLKTKQTGPDGSNSGEVVDLEDKSSEFELVKNGDAWFMDNVTVTDFE